MLKQELFLFNSIIKMSKIQVHPIYVIKVPYKGGQVDHVSYGPLKSQEHLLYILTTMWL